jgi:hypothetical protein
MKPHPQAIITPARTGGKTSQNRRRENPVAWETLAAAAIAAALFVATLGLISGHLTR